MSSHRRTNANEEWVSLEQQTYDEYAGLLAAPSEGVKWTTDYDDPSGFLLGDGWDQSGPWLVPKAVKEGGHYLERRYAVMRSRTPASLHRKFAKIALATEARQETLILEFANRYGFLGATKDLTRLVRRDGQRNDPALLSVGEHVRLWRDEICEIAVLVRIWDLINGAERDRLAKYILLTPRPKKVEARVSWNGTDIDLPNVPAARWSQIDVVADEVSGRGRYRAEQLPALLFQSPDVVTASQFWLFDRINRKLLGLASPQLKAEQRAPQRLKIQPHTLLSTIYLFFTFEIEGTDRNLTCENPLCSKTFLQKGRQKYCSRECQDQARYYRDREKRKNSRRRNSSHDDKIDDNAVRSSTNDATPSRIEA